MALFSSKRGRGSRAVTLRLPAGQMAALLGSLRNRSVLLRLSICVVACLALIVAVQGWKPAFPFRLNQQPLHGVTAKVKFERVNQSRTNRARERAAEQVPHILTNDSAPIRRLPKELEAQLLQASRVKTVSELPADTRSAFGLAATPSTPSANTLTPMPYREATFAKLQQIAADAAQLQAIGTAFTEFIKPLEQYGLIRPEHLPEGTTLSDIVTIVQSDGRRENVSVSVTQLPQLLAANGRLHQQWDKFPPLIPLRAELEHWLSLRAPETLKYDDALTQAARQQVRESEPEIRDVYNAGDVLVQPGQIITPDILQLLQAEYDQTEAQMTSSQRLIRVGVVFLLLLVLMVLNGYYLVRNEPRLVRNYGRLSIYLSVIVLTLALSRLLSFEFRRAEVAPVLAMVMVLAVAYNQVLATLTAFSLSLVLTLSTGADIGQFVVLMGACATAIILLPCVATRSTLVIVGGCSGVAYFVMYWGTALIGDQSSQNLLTDLTKLNESLMGSLWCFGAGFLVSGSLPFIEPMFGVVTDISLLELGDVSHPLLQELVRRAPGTYNHSITVASIGETAADIIGANGLLVRVGAYFHDIGKMLKPHYFVENNILGENRHENLAPAMSTLIIIGHVKDGVDLAEQHNLPQPLVDFIEQHHGTTLVEFFYHEAARLAEDQPDHRTDADESHFRYPGPKPQTREAAVLMIADAVEGASRALSEPTPKRLERLVHDISLKRLLDGQFDQSGLTLTELATIEDSLTKSLIAIYHARIKYPEPRTA